jgi:hypothetical protein
VSDIAEKIDHLAERIGSLEKRIEAVVVGRLDKEWYTTEEVAVLMDRAPWTVRQWCLQGRVRAKKRSGTDRWVVSRDEVERLMNEGLLKPARR